MAHGFRFGGSLSSSIGWWALEAFFSARFMLSRFNVVSKPAATTSALYPHAFLGAGETSTMSAYLPHHQIIPDGTECLLAMIDRTIGSILHQ